MSALSKQELRERYGKAELLLGPETGQILRDRGLRASLHPRDVVVGYYQSREAAEAYAASNRQHHDHEVLGPWPDGGRWLNIIALRGTSHVAFAVTDPSLPDDWKPPKKERAA